MKKIIIAIVAVVSMTMSVSAQEGSQANNSADKTQTTTVDTKDIEVPNFDKLCRHLDLTTSQREAFKPVMQQFYSYLDQVSRQTDPAKAGKMFFNAIDAHKFALGKILTADQQTEYWKIMETTLKNYAEKYQ